MKILSLGSAALCVALSLSACKKDKPATESAKKPTVSSTEPKPGAIPAPSDVAAPPADAQKTESGLAYKVLKAGAGDATPNPWDKVKVHYTGWTTDGKMFDSSKKRGRPATFGLRQVIPGWTEGLQLMKKGEETRFWIPKELAYNDKPGRPKGMLVFDVELLDIMPGPKPIPAPEDVAAAPADAIKTESGLAYKVLAPGKGKSPGEFDKVEVHYTGWMTNGEMFDSSLQRGTPVTFGVRGVIKGWTEGLQLMKEGEKTRMWIPGKLAYGDKPGRAGAPFGMLVFDVELLKVIEMPKPPPAPKDVAKIPANAKKTASGLAYRVLQKGKGTKNPTDQDRVQVHYSGWTTDGKMFDSSIPRNQPATFGVTRVIKGWTEGLKLMVEGEKRRFWIPAELAYGADAEKRGRPAGMLVFDVELLKIDTPTARPMPRPMTKAPGATKAMPSSRGEGRSTSKK